MLIIESQSLDVYRNLAIEEYLLEEVTDGHLQRDYGDTEWSRLAGQRLAKPPLGRALRGDRGRECTDEEQVREAKHRGLHRARATVVPRTGPEVPDLAAHVRRDPAARPTACRHCSSTCAGPFAAAEPDRRIDPSSPVTTCHGQPGPPPRDPGRRLPRGRELSFRRALRASEILDSPFPRPLTRGPHPPDEWRARRQQAPRS